MAVSGLLALPLVPRLGGPSLPQMDPALSGSNSPVFIECVKYDVREHHEGMR